MWKNVSEKYEASDTGQIRNKRTKRELKQFLGKDGYMRVQFDGKTKLTHRIIAEVFVHRTEGSDFVNHKDGHKWNNAAWNLEWCTRNENMQHAYRSGLKKRPNGIMNGRSILTYADVQFIKTHYVPRDKTYGALALAAKYGVAHQTICAVATGQNWKDRRTK